MIKIIKATPQLEFQADIKSLTNLLKTNNSRPLRRFVLFIDEQEHVRFGGRLESAALTHGAKYLVMLPYNDPLSQLQHFGCGPHTLLSHMRQRFRAIYCFWGIFLRIIPNTIAK